MTISIAGMMATLRKVFDPATASAPAALVPEATAAALKSSYHFPISGRISETENIPAPPISERPSAPDLGTYSATKPSIVGQKKQIPAANTSAAPNAA